MELRGTGRTDGRMLKTNKSSDVRTDSRTDSQKNNTVYTTHQFVAQCVGCYQPVSKSASQPVSLWRSALAVIMLKTNISSDVRTDSRTDSQKNNTVYTTPMG